MKRVKKSVLATSVAAAALVAGAITPVKAEDLATRTPEKNKEEVQSQDVTLEQVESSAKQVAEAQAKVDEQKSVVAANEAAQAATQEEEKAAEAAVSQAQELVAEATPEVIEAAETDLATAEAAVSEAEKAVATVVEEKAQVDSQIAAQEEKVAQAENSVTEAQTELAKAASAAAPEAKELTQAQAAEKAAADLVALRQSELASTEQAAQAQAAIQASQEQKIKQLESATDQTQSEIVAKEAEIAQAQRTASNQSVLKDTAYTGFLATLGNQVAFQQALNTANQNGLAANQSASPATMENALRAVEIMKEVNRYRRQAGLNELLVDPYKNVESQIKVIGFNREGWHTKQFFTWENVAWGFDAKAGVDYWYNEKAIYQTYAAQLGLPTDEKQLDPGQLYSQLGSDRFSKVGHYLTMMGRDFNTITAASSQIGKNYSEAGFHKADLSSGLYLTVADYEKALRNYINNATAEVNLAGLNSQLTALKNKQNQQSAELNNFKAALATTTTSLAEKNKAVNTAQVNLALANTKLATEKSNVAKATTNYNKALAQIEDSLRPQRAALEAAKANLQAEENMLKAQTAKQAVVTEKLTQAETAVTAAKVTIQTKKDHLEALKNSKEVLAKAQAALAATQAALVEKGQAVVQSKEELNLLLANLISLQENHVELLKRYRALHPEVDLSAIFKTGQPAPTNNLPGGAANGGEISPTNPNVVNSVLQSSDHGNPKQTQLSLKSKEPSSRVGSTTSALDTKVLSGAKMLPNTSSQANHLATAGLAVGAAALVAAGFARKREEK